ncbi:hypothetical protein XENOCAPTIV_011873 [Xenoophorus captivus]|uniref:Uncharacterized protein n=1 Tax=Xenoophorus captivus TaxID=1517983 RepID=A0ABV0S2R3_9TELE
MVTRDLTRQVREKVVEKFKAELGCKTIFQALNVSLTVVMVVGGSSCNRWVAGPNPRSVCLSCCVLEQDTLLALPADGGQRSQWCRLYGSLTSVSLTQGSCGYNVVTTLSV